MNTKHGCLAIFLLLVPFSFFAQTAVPERDYWKDESGRFHQVIRWVETDSLYYDVEIERRDEYGQWHPLERRRTEDTFLELTLSPGAYRFRVHTYNVLEKLSGTSDWTSLWVYEAKVPDADRIRSLKVAGGTVSFTITISGKNLVEGAELYLISRKKNSKPIQALSLDYSFNESWIKAEFPTAAVSRGSYNLVITNPGGLSQTLEDMDISISRAPGSAGLFDLDNTKSWSIGLTGTAGINLYKLLDPDYAPYKEGTSMAIFGAALNFTFYEKYKSYGKFFFLPNVFFAELSYTAKNAYMEQYQSPNVPSIEVDKRDLTFDLGALYKIRLGKYQRFVYNFGASFGLGADFYDGTHYNTSGLPLWEGSSTSLYYYITVRTGLSFRISPNYSLDFGIAFGGGSSFYDYPELFAWAKKPEMVNFFLGVSYRRPY